jgi:hypothetical protein
LSRTYALLFSESSNTRERYDRLIEIPFLAGLPLKRDYARSDSLPIEFDPSSHQAQSLLRLFYATELPNLVLQAFPDLRNSFQEKPSVQKLMEHGAPYSRDAVMIIQAILIYNIREKESFTSFGPYEENLRQLKAFLDECKPATFLDLWKDRRDSLSWYTVWAAIIFGGVSLLLGFISVALSIAQVYTGFKALNSS